MPTNLVHLHNHTDASTLDGGQSVKQLVTTAKELECNAVGITDHGNMINALEFQKECDKQGIKPIIGCEFYVGEPDSQDTFHLILIAKNNIGLRNLYTLNTLAYMTNFYKKPRINFNMLVMYNEGLICTTACLGSEFSHIILDGDSNLLRTLKDRLLTYKNIFREDFYLELQVNGIPQQNTYNTNLAIMSLELDIPLTVSCDTHYAKQEHFEAHDTLLCMQTKKKKADVNRFKFSCNDFYLKDEVQIAEELYNNEYICTNLFIFDHIIDKTQEIANKCNARIETNLGLLPHVPGVTNEDYTLAQHCNEGFKRRLEEGAFNNLDINTVVKRISYELSVIREKGYSGYFLIVEDFMKAAKEKNILTGCGRGSCCGSEVAFILGITRVEPIKYNLLFERFLNPERMSAPDVDSDFDNEYRDIMIQYVKEKYGEENVAHIMAKGTLSTFACIRKVMSVYDFDMRYINQINKSVRIYKDNHSKADICELYDEVEEFRNFALQYPEAFRDMCVLEGLMSHISKHAAGVAICSEPITNYVPCMRDSDDHTMLMTQWDKHDIEEVGLYKFDFLGLKTLTLFRRTIDNIKKNRNVVLNLEKIEKDAISDPNIYSLLNSGNLQGIFQFSAPSGKQIISQIKPTCFDDIIAAEALCRPGVKERDLFIRNKTHGYSRTSYSQVDKILEETYGAIVYQEQTMLLMHEIAGWSLGKADKMRKVKNLEEYREDFVNSALARSYQYDFANEIFDRFSLEYSFNKSHAAAYAINSAATCYLSYYYPAEFMSALMTQEMVETDNELKYQIQECRLRGIEILPPDINTSQRDFIPVENRIMYPITGIKNVGEAAVEEILNKRVSCFSSVDDFVNRVLKKKVNKRCVEQLIKAGAFDNMIESNRIQALPESEYSNVTWSDFVKADMELKTFGFYLTTHPTKQYIIPDSESEILGIITDLKLTKDKNNNTMAFFKLENYLKTYGCVMFSYDYSKYKNVINNGGVLQMKLAEGGLNSCIVKEVYVA